MTLEGGVGKVFIKNQGKQLIQVGAVGYAQFQLTNDSGAAVLPLTANNKDRVFAIGPELGVILPTRKFNFLVRVLPEFGARNRTQGVTLVVRLARAFRCESIRMFEKLPSRRRCAIPKPLVVISGLFLLVLLSDTRPIKAQEPTTRDEFWPAIEVYINVKPKVRLYLVGSRQQDH